MLEVVSELSLCSFPHVENVAEDDPLVDLFISHLVDIGKLSALLPQGSAVASLSVDGVVELLAE